MRTFNKSYQKVLKEYNIPDDPISGPPAYDADLDTSSAYEGIQSQYLSSDPGDADPDLVAYVKKEVKDIVDESGLSVEEALKIVKEELPDVIQAIGVDEFTGEFNLDIEDNEEPKRTIRSFRDRPPRTDPSFKGQVTSSEDIDKIDLSKWKEYRAEDVMKAVYRQYGKELPSVDSRDWEMSWDKKVRPWLKNKFPNS